MSWCAGLLGERIAAPSPATHSARAFGCSALHLAALGGHAGTAGALRAGGAPLAPAGGLGGASPLHAAAARASPNPSPYPSPNPEQVHGVYAPGNVQLDPEILGNSQVYIADKIGAAEGSKPVSFVFHGGG